jgi:hypothetical protein
LENGKSVDSNVCLIYQAVARESADGTQQVKVYDTGVGSSYEWRDKILGGTMGRGLDQKIMDMYSFLMLNYQPGDELYFSQEEVYKKITGLLASISTLLPLLTGMFGKPSAKTGDS